jgi:hypothetical protein
MKRSAGFQVALAATLTFLLGTTAALAVTKPFVLFKFKDCGTSSNCLLSFSPVPAGVHWEVKQIACADNLEPTTVNLLAVYVVIMQSTGLNPLAAAYPFVPVATGIGGTETNWISEATVFIPVANGQQIQIAFPIDTAATGQHVQCTLAGETITN